MDFWSYNIIFAVNAGFGKYFVAQK